jgi:hypothetical protein
MFTLASSKADSSVDPVHKNAATQLATKMHFATDLNAARGERHWWQWAHTKTQLLSCGFTHSGGEFTHTGGGFTTQQNFTVMDSHTQGVDAHTQGVDSQHNTTSQLWIQTHRGWIHTWRRWAHTKTQLFSSATTSASVCPASSDNEPCIGSVSDLGLGVRCRV